MVERFNGCVGTEVLAITISSHKALKQLLRGFNAAYNGRRQRVLDGRTPNQVVAERLVARPELASAKSHARADPCDTIWARLIVEAAQGRLATGHVPPNVRLVAGTTAAVRIVTGHSRKPATASPEQPATDPTQYAAEPELRTISGPVESYKQTAPVGSELR